MAAILEAANDARSLVSPAVVSIANQLARMSLFPDDAAAVLDGLREGLLRNQFTDLAEEVARVADQAAQEAE